MVISAALLAAFMPFIALVRSAAAQTMPRMPSRAKRVA
jgi:hypothetical protein